MYSNSSYEVSYSLLSRVKDELNQGFTEETPKEEDDFEDDFDFENDFDEKL